MNKNKNMIDDWLARHGDPEINKFVDKNLDIVDKVHEILKEQNISKTTFAKMLGKKPSEVSRWLTGLHNLTLKSIIKMETALGVDLIYTEPRTEHEYHFIEIPGKQNVLSEGTVKYESSGEELKPEFEFGF